MSDKKNILNESILNNEEHFEEFDFSSIQHTNIDRMPPPFQPPTFPGGGFNPNFPTGGFNPNFPDGGFNPNPSGGGFNPNQPNNGFNPNQKPNMQLGAPPNYTPSKKDKGVQSFGSSQGGPQTKSVSPNSIRFCLFQFTYIWEVNGRSYWCYIIQVDNRTVTGFRWFGRSWAYFGIDLRRIDSFVCYRNECTNCYNGTRFIDSDKEQPIKEYSTSLIRDIYCKPLFSYSIPEVKNETTTKEVGTIDHISIETNLSCIKTRNTNYRLVLEVSYPETFDNETKNTIIELADTISNDSFSSILNSRNNNQYNNSLELFSRSSNTIEESLREFSSNFILKLQTLSVWEDHCRNINFIVRQEKTSDDWTTYYQ